MQCVEDVLVVVCVVVGGLASCAASTGQYVVVSGLGSVAVSG